MNWKLTEDMPAGCIAIAEENKGFYTRIHRIGAIPLGMPTCVGDVVVEYKQVVFSYNVPSSEDIKTPYKVGKYPHPSKLVKGIVFGLLFVGVFILTLCVLKMLN